jgi:hypothetical protein
MPTRFVGICIRTCAPTTCSRIRRSTTPTDSAVLGWQAVEQPENSGGQSFVLRTDGDLGHVAELGEASMLELVHIFTAAGIAESSGREDADRAVVEPALRDELGVWRAGGPVSPLRRSSKNATLTGGEHRRRRIRAGRGAGRLWAARRMG